MSLDENKLVVRRVYLESLNTRNLELLDELFAPDYVVHYPGVPAITGRDAAKDLLSAFLTAFPDIVFRIEQQIAEGDLVATSWVGEGTHSGEFRGFPEKTSVIAPTGKPVNFSANDIYWIVDGLIKEEWNSLSPVDVLLQVGGISRLV